MHLAVAVPLGQTLCLDPCPQGGLGAHQGSLLGILPAAGKELALAVQHWTESCILLLACLLLLVKTRRFRGPMLLVVPRKSCHAPLPAACQARRSPSCSPLCLPAEQFRSERSHPQKALSHFLSPPP